MGESTSAAPEARTAAAAPPRRGWKIALAVLAGALVLASFVGAIVLLAFSVQVSGHSMAPTLTPGDRLFVNFTQGGGKASRFDIVQVRLGPQREQAVKRLIGLPGDQVRVRFADGHEVVELKPADGQWSRVDNPAWRDADEERRCCDVMGRAAATTAAATVPAGMAWLLGDNLDGSDDSRTYGFVQLSEIGATLNLRVLPLGDFGRISHDDVRLIPLN